MKLKKALSSAAIRLASRLERPLVRLVYPDGTQASDFLAPAGEPALLDVDSTAWRVMANPVSLLVGGVTAVLLELAEPRVRSGVWEHTAFRSRPLQRLQRTGYAAMMTAFGARSRAEDMIARINAGHARIAGRTPAGVAYVASDSDLLTWVHATATFGFLEGYANCVRQVDANSRDRFYADNQASARLYGVSAPPACAQDFDDLLNVMLPELEASEIVLEFLAVMRSVPLMPVLLRPLQSLLIRAAVQNLPAVVRERLGLAGAPWRVAPWQWRVLRAIGRAVDGLPLPSLPEVLARRRVAAPRALSPLG